MLAGNGDEVIALLYWGDEIVKTGCQGSVDYSLPPKTTCFLQQVSSYEELVAKVQAAMDPDNKKKKDDSTSLGLFGRYPTTFAGDKGGSVSIPLTDNRSWRWFLREMLGSQPLHVYVVAAAKGKGKWALQSKLTGAAKTAMKIFLVFFLIVCVFGCIPDMPKHNSRV
ncbi:unnamed protein product [Cuscuta europaea]|uniref:Uncharacterized protein n=1 Tax=Cuscuta europaea TaxID=41803 RepID=A0A9P1EJ89_CUSEU|nr:unnamed protein product [Cuscuta europaea]